ncbi:MAG: hypothetical protein AB7E32_09645 [Desulfovibrio sp.]
MYVARHCPTPPVRLLPPLALLLPTLLLSALLAACLPKAAPEPLAPGPEWTAERDPGRLDWQPRRMAGDEAARRALADVAPLLHVPGRTNSTVRVRFATPDLLVFETAWTEYEWRSPVIRRWPGIPHDPFCDPFCEEEVGPPVRVALPRNSALVLPLGEINDIRLYRLATRDASGADSLEWRVRVFHENGRLTELAAAEPRSSILLADALFTLSTARGATRPSRALPQFADLTPAQAALLEIPGGVLVLSWPLSPDAVESALSLAWPDVILQADGQPATAALLERLLTESGTQNSPLRLKGLRWGLYKNSPKPRTRVFDLDLTLPDSP